MRDVLQALAAGEITIEEAHRRLNLYAIQQVGGIANLDTGRMTRTGKPEIVRCAGKPVEQAIELALPFLDEPGVVALSGATATHETALRAARPNTQIHFEPTAGVLIARDPEKSQPRPIGTTAIVTAGASDMPIALQTQLIAEMLGVETTVWSDIGISGLHRLFPALEAVVELDPDVVVVIAGQEGGLAPVVAGILDVPIIAVPTSTGTGYGGEGIGALSTMLQSCSLGLAVVNIDNGIAAGVMAATIVRRATRNRESPATYSPPAT